MYSISCHIVVYIKTSSLICSFQLIVSNEGKLCRRIVLMLLAWPGVLLSSRAGVEGMCADSCRVSAMRSMCGTGVGPSSSADMAPSDRATRR